MKNYEKLVDELLKAIDAAKMNGTNSRVDCAIAALKPKPKFYMLPEYWAATDDMRVAFQLLGDWSKSEAEPLWYRLREATATDKPMVHIPAGKDWAKDDLRKLWMTVVSVADYGDYIGITCVIDDIKAKLESKS